MRVISKLPQGLELINHRLLREPKSGLYLLSKLNHHSFSDWTQTATPAGWTYNRFELDPSKYVSAPSSVKMDIVHLTQEILGIAVCNIATVSDLKEGRIVTWIWRYTNPAQVQARIIFGAQGGVTDTFFYKSITAIESTWKKVRFTWWNSYDLFNVAKLATRIDTWDGSVWTNGAIIYINRLTGSINKCGIGQQANAMYRPIDWWDDTEIWG